MFGHQDDQSVPTAGDAAMNDPINGVTNSTDAEDQPSGAPSQTPSAMPTAPTQPDPVASPAPPPPPPTDNSNDNPDWQHPGNPIDDNKETVTDAVSPAGGYPMRPTFQYSADAVPTDDTAAAGDDSNTHELIDIKDKALDELSPLIDKLDLSPKEKFQTLMMMIQASDNQNLVKAAYAAAHAIEDEKAKAQALLDIVNEINYFTQHPDN